MIQQKLLFLFFSLVFIFPLVSASHQVAYRFDNIDNQHMAYNTSVILDLDDYFANFTSDSTVVTFSNPDTGSGVVLIQDGSHCNTRFCIYLTSSNNRINITTKAVTMSARSITASVGNHFQTQAGSTFSLDIASTVTPNQIASIANINLGSSGNSLLELEDFFDSFNSFSFDLYNRTGTNLFTTGLRDCNSGQVFDNIPPVTPALAVRAGPYFNIASCRFFLNFTSLGQHGLFNATLNVSYGNLGLTSLVKFQVNTSSTGSPQYPSQIFSLAPVELEFEEIYSVDLNTVFLNFTSVTAQVQRTGESITVSRNGGSDSIVEDEYSLVLSSTNSTEMTFYIQAGSDAIEEDVTLIFTNSFGQTIMIPDLTFTISGEGSGGGSGGTGFIASWVDLVDALYPDSSDLNLRQKMFYMFITILLIDAILILGTASSVKGLPQPVIWFMIALDILIFVGFVSIGYVPVGILIFILVIAILLIYLRSKGG